jgi:lipopolysaccharide/colanic/teichoic acid biosynthesis glycosyltransferase
MKMNCDVLEGRAGVSLQGAKKSSSWFGKNVRVGRNVNIIAPVIIGDNTVIEDNAQIVGPAAIGADCRVGPAAVIRESTIWSGASIAAKASVARSIITCGGRVNAGRCIRDTVVVKDELKSATVNLLSRNFKITTIASSTAKRLPAVRRRRVFELVKRTIDVTFALILIVMLLPLMGILALAIKLDSPGPVFFRQRRCGLHGREFTLLKYRSMIPDAHQRQKEFKHLNEIDGPVFKIANDPRVTGVGRLLRKLSLDEIPQLFNILRGDMSFVGPRPLARNELRLNPSWSETRLQVKPGLTGLWQISGRSDSSFQDWVALDTYYARNQNLGLDLKILAQTPLKVVLGAGAC